MKQLSTIQCQYVSGGESASEQDPFEKDLSVCFEMPTEQYSAEARRLACEHVIDNYRPVIMMDGFSRLAIKYIEQKMQTLRLSSPPNDEL